MNITPVNCNAQKFQHKVDRDSNKYSARERMIVAGATALGVGTSLVVLASNARTASGKKYSFSPLKMFKNIKKSYLANVKFEMKEVISIGAGTCLGGLTGGYLIDKNKNNREAKRREAVMQFGNISIPIATVHYCSKWTERFGKVAQSVGSVGGIFAGVYLANFLMNKLSNRLFENKNERGVKATDFAAHLDDVIVAAGYISDAPLVQKIGRLVPLALMVAGNEVGNKKA